MVVCGCLCALYNSYQRLFSAAAAATAASAADYDIAEVEDDMDAIASDETTVMNSRWWSRDVGLYRRLVVERKERSKSQGDRKPGREDWTSSGGKKGERIKGNEQQTLLLLQGSSYVLMRAANMKTTNGSMKIRVASVGSVVLVPYHILII